MMAIAEECERKIKQYKIKQWQNNGNSRQWLKILGNYYKVYLMETMNKMHRETEHT